MTNCQINLAPARDGSDVGADGSEPPTAALTSRVIARGSVIFRPSTAAFGKFSMRVPAHSAGLRNGIVAEPVTPPVQLPCRARPPMRKLPGDSHSSSCAERTDLGAIGGYIRGGVTLASPRSGSGQTRTCGLAIPNFRFSWKSGHPLLPSGCLRSARNRHRAKWGPARSAAHTTPPCPWGSRSQHQKLTPAWGLRRCSRRSLRQAAFAIAFDESVPRGRAIEQFYCLSCRATSRRQ